MKKLFSFVAAVLCTVSMSAAVDVLTADSIGVPDGTKSYADYTGVKATSDAVYAVNCMKNELGAIQLRSDKSNSGIVSTTSGGKLKSVRIVWNTKTTSGRTVLVYGSNTAYTSPADLYGANAGDSLGAIVIDGETTTVTVEGDYAYVGLRSKKGALYLDSISIEWEGSASPEPEPEPEPVVVDTLTCAAAAAKALEGATNEVVVIGYVTEIKTAWSSQYKNISFWMADSVNGGQVFQAFRAVCATAEDAPIVGDKVFVQGKLTTHNDTVPEMAAGCTYFILEHAVEPEPEEPVEPAVIDTLTCAAAAEKALAGSSDSAVVIGYVTEIKEEWSSQYKNISFWMADSVNGGLVFQAHRAACATAEDAPVVGDKVSVKGKLTTYKDTVPEMAAGCTFTILEHAAEPEEPEEPVLPTVIDTLTCVAAADSALAGVTDTVVVIGYVTEIKEAWSSQYKNLSFWMADSVNGGLVFQAHRAACATAEDAPSVGDKVSVKGKLTTYKDTVPEMAAGCTFTILEHATEPDEPVVPTVIDTLTCAAAAEAALAGVTDSAVVIGYVTEIAYAWSAESKNLSFWMADSVNGGKVFEAYKAVCESEENVPGVGDKVAIKGKLMKFNNTPEMTGCTFTILERNAVEPEEKGEVTIAEFLELKDGVNIYTLTGTVSNIVMDKTDTTQYNVYGNFDLTDATGTIYIYGLLTAEGESKKFQEMGIDEGDTVTLKGSYTEYNGAPQIKNAILVSKTDKEMGLESVLTESPAEKRVVNGQLVIIRNGVMYNAAGTRME